MCKRCPLVDEHYHVVSEERALELDRPARNSCYIFTYFTHNQVTKRRKSSNAIHPVNNWKINATNCQFINFLVLPIIQTKGVSKQNFMFMTAQ